MQGLMHYADSPSPPAKSASGPSRPRIDKIDTPAPPAKRARLSPPPVKPAVETQRQRAAAVPTPQAVEVSVASSAGSSSTAKGKGRSREEPILVDQDDLPENLTHTAQAALPKSTLADEPVSLDEKAAEENGFGALYAGMTDQEVFDAVTRPDGIAGLEDWGIPPAADPSECSPQLKAKVAQFLALKYSRNQHINTSLLSSSTFHNPHIYSKLVEFVDLDERRSNFPGKGWATRIGLEGDLREYSPRMMSDVQKRKQEDVKKGQETGKRNTIQFQSGRGVKPGQSAAGVSGSGAGTGRAGGNGTGASALVSAANPASAGNTAERRSENERRDRDKVRQRQRDGDRDKERRDRVGRDRPREGLSGKYRDTLGFGRDRDGGWDERDMKKEKPKYRYY